MLGVKIEDYEQHNSQHNENLIEFLQHSLHYCLLSRIFNRSIHHVETLPLC